MGFWPLDIYSYSAALSWEICSPIMTRRKGLRAVVRNFVCVPVVHKRVKIQKYYVSAKTAHKQYFPQVS